MGWCLTKTMNACNPVSQPGDSCRSTPSTSVAPFYSGKNGSLLNRRSQLAMIFKECHLFPGERKQLLNEVSGTLSGLWDVRQIGMERTPSAHLAGGVDCHRKDKGLLESHTYRGWVFRCSAVAAFKCQLTSKLIIFSNINMPNPMLKCPKKIFPLFSLH